MEIRGKFYTLDQLETMVGFYEQKAPKPFINKDVEYYILLDMSLEDLREIQQVNKYLKQLLNTDEFWCQYLSLHYRVSYKSECLHIGKKLMNNVLSTDEFFNLSIKQRDVAVVKFLLDARLISDLTFEILQYTTYPAMIKVLLSHIDGKYVYGDVIYELVVRDNIHAVSALLEKGLLSNDDIKSIFKYDDRITDKMEALLLKYYIKDEKYLSRSPSRSDDSSDSSDDDQRRELPFYGDFSDSTSDSSDDDRRRKSPIKKRNKSPIKKRNKSPIKKRSKSPMKKTYKK